MAESLLLAALRQDSGEHVFKYIAPPDAGRLERAFTSELVFVPAGGGEALLRSYLGTVLDGGEGVTQHQDKGGGGSGGGGGASGELQQ